MTDVAPSSMHSRASATRFSRILCGVDGSRPAAHALEQALALAGPGTRVHFVAICDAMGVGPNERATLGAHRAREALEMARERARGAGVETTADLLQDPRPAQRLVELAADHDLLVIGSHGHSRAAEIAVGGAAGLAAHRSPAPVLIARSRERGAPFPGTVVAATDGRGSSRDAVETAARLAGPAPLVLVHGTDHEGPLEHHVLAREAATVIRITGRDPVVVCEHRRPVDLILDVADDQRAGLIVMGSGGRTGVRALGSVSERVCARARCSVLVLRSSAVSTG